LRFEINIKRVSGQKWPDGLHGRVAYRLRYLLLFFQDIQCQFSKHSFDNLTGFLNLDLCQYIVSFIYIILEIIKSSRDLIDLRPTSFLNFLIIVK
jgi:hypothetical protein